MKKEILFDVSNNLLNTYPYYSKSDFFSGFFSAYDIFGITGEYNIFNIFKEKKIDKKSIEADWYAVGFDIYFGIIKSLFEYENSLNSKNLRKTQLKSSKVLNLMKNGQYLKRSK